MAPRDHAAADAAVMVETAEKPRPREERLYCVRCGHLVTLGTWRIAVNGEFEHVTFNPAGYLFRIGCFEAAPGAVPAGRPSGEFTWFKGYVWRLAFCGGCEAHLGWRFTGGGGPPAFYGLVLGRLTDKGAG